MCAECDFEGLAQKLNAELDGKAGPERDLTLREWCARIVSQYGHECYARVQTLLSLLRDSEKHGIAKGAEMARSEGPATWERVLAWVAGLLILAVLCFAVIRNDEFKDPNLVVFARAMLSLLAGIVGITLPGMMSVDAKWRGLNIRATSGFALAFLFYWITPTVLPRNAVAIPAANGGPEVQEASVLAAPETPGN